MNVSDPKELLGKRETHNLEFKSADVLKHPVTVAREVVAFLNADGGEVWIGVKEHEGAAVSLEPIQNLEAGCGALWNHLIDVIEPSPTKAEVSVEPMGGIIRIAVSNGAGRRPYAVRKDKGRQYVLRIAERIREMSREEVAKEFKRTAAPEDPIDAVTRIGQAIDAERNSSGRRFWYQLVPRTPLNIDFENVDPDTKRFFEDLLTNPQASGNRRDGWSMVFFHDAMPRIRTNEVEHSFGSGKDQHLVKIQNDGTMTFAAPRDRLDRDWDPKGGEIFPYALLELPVSGFRIASKVLGRFPPKSGHEGKVVCGAVIGGVAGATLRPGSPHMPRLPWKQPRRIEKDLVVEPFEIEALQIIKTPDDAAYRLIRRLYEQVGFSEAEIPGEFELSNGARFLRLGR